MLVSVIIPTFNTAHYLVRSVDSALNQTYSNLEVIIIDDGSTDNTAEVVKARYSGDIRVRYLYQYNAGPSVARNRGVREARGEFVHFLDSDEFLHPTKIQKSYALFREKPEIGVVYGHGIPLLPHTDEELPMEYPPLPSGWVMCDWLKGRMSGGTYGVTSSFMVRRDAVLEAGGFREDQRVAEDWDLWIRLAARYPFAALEDKLVYYYRRSEGLHSSRLNMALGRLQTFQQVRRYAGREKCLTDQEYRQMLASRWHVVAERYWEAHQPAEARQAFKEAIKLYPTRSRYIFYLLTYFFTSFRVP
jgi:glycosyltransferase involved in cell wall biosynthesis